MPQWRITKFDPALRDEAGRFTRDDWSSVSDIGRVCAGVVVTLEAYLRVEDAYVAAALDFLAAAGNPRLVASGVEHAGRRSRVSSDAITPPEEGEAVSELEAVIRSCLREEMWCRLQSLDGTSFIHFGWDYYMYIGTSAPAPPAIERARSSGLFVEEWISPYHEARERD